MIYTFYSYKGGVGRSMALANVGELFYRAGLNVLLVDWDLEAPGLERFFAVDAEEISGHPGVVDMLLDYKYQLPQKWTGADVQFKKPSDFVIDLYPGSRRGRLQLLTSGQRDKANFTHYADTVLTFDWKDFYDNYEGEAYFEWLRQQFFEMADVVLIDSRTGITEMGGVCTYQLADVVVAFCTTNQQSLNGTAKVLSDLQRSEVREARGRPLKVIAIPARVEKSEGEFLGRFKEQYLALFSTSAETLGITNGQLWDLRIPYIPYYAYEETRPVRDSMAIAQELSRPFKLLTLMLSRLADEGSKVRHVFPTIKTTQDGVSGAQVIDEQIFIGESSFSFVTDPDADLIADYEAARDLIDQQAWYQAYQKLTELRKLVQGSLVNRVEQALQQTQAELKNETKERVGELLGSIQTQDKEAIAWFAHIGLIGNPFEHLTAEEDEALSRYRIQLQGLRPLEKQICGDDIASRWIIFAKRGCGKTALCQMVRQSHYPFKKDHILGIMLDSEALNNVLAYADHSLETLLPAHYIKVIENLIPDSVKTSKLAYTSGANARQALSALSQVIIRQGFKYLLCLVDQVDEVELVEAQPEKMVQLLKPLMQLSQQTLPGVAFRYFLPAELESLMQAQHTIFRLDRYQVVHLRWTEEDLARLIAQRLSAFSKSALNPYTSLGQLCEPGTNFDAPVDLVLVRLAEGSPRAVVWLANRLIQVHCQAENPPRFIQPATWQQVKADWRLYGREQLFGSPARSEAFVLAGDRIYFQGEEVVLSEKHDALLRCLIQAGDRVCTKEELIRAGWPGEEPEGVTEAALAEAVRRMKVELKKLGYDPGWVKTVRGRGYRLQKPKTHGAR